MDQFSPITRRILAAGLLILLLLLVLQGLLLPLLGAIQEKREELAGLRNRNAHLSDVRDRPLPRMSVLPAGATIRAPASAAAIARLEMVTRQAADTAGINLRSKVPRSPPLD